MSYTAAVITVSDKGYAGLREDTSGPAVCSLLRECGYTVCFTAIVPDEAPQIAQVLKACADEKKISFILTTGGTGFSPRDCTPEATLSVLERECRGIPEAMRAESLRITPRGCLSRSVAGIRGRSLIVNLPGSRKAALENLQAVLPALEHGLQMLASGGSADCAEQPEAEPSMDTWLREAKQAENAQKVGMYLFHTGVVRQTARAQVRGGAESAPVEALIFDYDAQKVGQAVQETYRMEGIYYVRTWLCRGRRSIGQTLMYVLVGGDTRPHTVAALEWLVNTLKTACVTEQELYHA